MPPCYMCALSLVVFIIKIGIKKDKIIVATPRQLEGGPLPAAR